MPKKKRKKRKSRYHRGEYKSIKSGTTYKFRSEWEAKYMVHLDTDPLVSSWTYEQTVIEYISNIRTKKVRRYYPDFTVNYSDGRSEVIEIKPRYKVNQLLIKKKSDAARSWCLTRGIEYKIITEIELKEMGLL